MLKTDSKSWLRGQKVGRGFNLETVDGSFTADFSRSTGNGFEVFQALLRQFWALTVGKVVAKSGKNGSEIRTFLGQNIPFFAVFCPRRPSPRAWGLLWRISLNPGHVGVED